MKSLFLSCALVCALALPLSAQTAPRAASSASSAPRPVPAWVTTSNAHARPLLDAQMRFQPERASLIGIPGYDHLVADLGPDHGARFREAIAQARAGLQQALRLERDRDVRRDLEIMIAAADEAIAVSATTERLQLPWVDAPLLMFNGVRSLLSEQTPMERRAFALQRLRTYVGLAPGSTPLTTLARRRYEERVGDADLLRPTRAEVEQALANADTYARGVRDLFVRWRVRGAEPALRELDAQIAEHAAWVRREVLPQARTDMRLPRELYALRLEQMGIDIPPEQLIRRAHLGFMETRAAMALLAPLVAKDKGFADDDYRSVIRALKRETIPDDRLEARYREVIDAIDAIIRRERIVDLPQRPMVMRLGTAAESAAQPAPHFLSAPLIGDTGQQGQFVLPIGNPALAGEDQIYDDFNYPAVAWTLSAHEGRPGHDLQFTAIVERGVSLARTLFAYTPVNVEGWALYAEAEMLPHLPLDGQLIALQFRLMRAARAMLDPMLHLGLIDRARAEQVLVEDVGLSRAMARQELDRYGFNAPGQGCSYFYGYTRILELRAETELALGRDFDRLAFNNFLLDQGMLPPDLLEKAVREEFVPAQRGSR